MNPPNTKRLVWSALFLAVGMVLPLLTGQIKEIGDSLLPMHLPVMLCGFLCGPYYGVAVGLLLPFLRSVLFGMPPLYPNCIWMAAELTTYGFVTGIAYGLCKKKSLGNLSLCLLIAMISGRLVWGIAKTLLLGVTTNGFTLQAFWIGGFVDAIPGIILQFILIPPIIRLTEHYRNRSI